MGEEQGFKKKLYSFIMVYCSLYRLDCDVVNGTGEPSADLASAQDGTNNLVVNQGLTYHQYLKVGKLLWSSIINDVTNSLLVILKY